MVFLWFSYGFPMVFLWLYRYNPTVYSCFFFKSSQAPQGNLLGPQSWDYPRVERVAHRTPRRARFGHVAERGGGRTRCATQHGKMWEIMGKSWKNVGTFHHEWRFVASVKMGVAKIGSHMHPTKKIGQIGGMVALNLHQLCLKIEVK